MAEPPSPLEGTVWRGRCPACPDAPDMLLNHWDNYECPACHQQIGQEFPGAALLFALGQGNYKRLESGKTLPAANDGHLFLPMVIVRDGRPRSRRTA